MPTIAPFSHPIETPPTDPEEIFIHVHQPKHSFDYIYWLRFISFSSFSQQTALKYKEWLRKRDDRIMDARGGEQEASKATREDKNTKALPRTVRSPPCPALFFLPSSAGGSKHCRNVIVVLH